MMNPILDLTKIQRNQYYDRMLLTAEDFIIEQEYLNLKRRILNRTLFGYGIVMGLEVVIINKKEIVIKPGMAIDPSGREIIVPIEKRLQSLSEVEGFKKDSESNMEKIGIYIQYEEAGRIEDFSIASTELKFRRIKESYKLVAKKFFKTEPKKEEAFDKIFTNEDCSVLLGTLDIKFLDETSSTKYYTIEGEPNLDHVKKCKLIQLYS